MWWRRTNFFNIFDVTWWSGSNCMCLVKRMKEKGKEKKEVFQVLWLFYKGPWLATNSRILLNKNKSSLILFPSGIDFKIINMQSVVFLILWIRVFPKCIFPKVGILFNGLSPQQSFHGSSFAVAGFIKSSFGKLNVPRTWGGVVWGYCVNRPPETVGSYSQTLSLIALFPLTLSLLNSPSVKTT